MRQTLGIVDIVVAGETAKYRLPQKPCQQMPGVPAAPNLRKSIARHHARPEHLIQLAIRKQTGVGGGLAAVEFQLQAPVKTDPQRPSVRFTHRMHHRRPPIAASTH